MFVGHSRSETSKGGVQFGDAFGELYSMPKEAIYNLGSFELVGFHGSKYTPILTKSEIIPRSLAL